jgi:energy-coupling factor transporter transmembrane protein EcfT
MKKRFVIRLNRKNELNAAWVFLILWTVAFLIIALTAKCLTEVLITILGSVLILFIALIYQGFEVIQE